MAVVTLTRDTWTQINTAAGRLQVFGGRVMVADSATPATDDWHVWPEGSIVDVVVNKFAKAVDTDPTWTVSVNI